MPENTHNSKDAGSYLCRVMTRHSQEQPRRTGMCVRLLKRACSLGPWAETLAKWARGLLALSCGDCRSGSGGRCPVLSVQVVSGQSTTHAAGENPGSSPKPRASSPENCQCSGSFAQPRCPGGVAGCTPGFQ